MQNRLAIGIKWRGISALRPLIIQNGNLVGALAHVCVNDPTSI
ncbi:MAG: hypothetical protein E7440_01085 [Ruminococcaceae bacterium]|nr:hypothetical protein [Oscillospiraceae bacterium]